jgi:hypothetical protein
MRNEPKINNPKWNGNALAQESEAIFPNPVLLTIGNPCWFKPTQNHHPVIPTPEA